MDAALQHRYVRPVLGDLANEARFPLWSFVKVAGSLRLPLADAAARFQVTGRHSVAHNERSELSPNERQHHDLVVIICRVFPTSSFIHIGTLLRLLRRPRCRGRRDAVVVNPPRVFVAHLLEYAT